MKISGTRLRQIIREEIKRDLLREDVVSHSASIMRRIGQAYSGGMLVQNSKALGEIVKGSVDMAVEEFARKGVSNFSGLAALEMGLIGIAIGVPMLFFREYEEGKKGDNMARWMSKHMQGGPRPVALKDVLDPRKPGTVKKIIAQGGDAGSNPILYLASQPNLKIAQDLFKEKIISADLYRAVHDIYAKAMRAKKELLAIKKKSESSEQV